MAKRGQLVVKLIIVLFFSLVVIIAYPYIGKQFGSGESYKKEIAAKEIALIIDTLYAYPYDAVIYYEKDLTGLAVQISDNDVIIYDSRFSNSNLDPTYRKYSFYPTGTNKIQMKFDNPKRIKFEKSKEKLIIIKDGTS